MQLTERWEKVRQSWCCVAHGGRASAAVFLFLHILSYSVARFWRLVLVYCERLWSNGVAMAHDWGQRMSHISREPNRYQNIFIDIINFIIKTENGNTANLHIICTSLFIKRGGFVAFAAAVGTTYDGNTKRNASAPKPKPKPKPNKNNNNEFIGNARAIQKNRNVARNVWSRGCAAKTINNK